MRCKCRHAQGDTCIVASDLSTPQSKQKLPNGELLFILRYSSIKSIYLLIFAVVPKMGFSIRKLSQFSKVDAKLSMQSASLHHTGSIAG